MAAILYIETNYLWGVAKGQETPPEALFVSPPEAVRLVIPSVCFMEAFCVLKFQMKRRRETIEQLRSSALVRDAERDRSSALARALLSHSEGLVIEGGKLLDLIEQQLFQVIDHVSRRAEILPLEPSVLEESLNGNLVEDDPTDNLILESIVRHAGRQPPGPKAFFSCNTSDFRRNPAVWRALRQVGVRYIASSRDLAGWIGSLRSPESGSDPLPTDQ